MQKRFAGAVCALAVGSVVSQASAQLVVGSTATTGFPSATYVDLATNTQTTLWNSVANKKVNGLAADIANQKLYSNDAARLNFWNFGSVGTAPTAIAGMYRTNDNVSFAATGVDGLAFANGTLYGSTSFASTIFKRGIYSINTVPDAGAHCVMTPVWTDTTTTTVLGGLEFDPDNGLFYATSSAADGGHFAANAFYSIDALGSGTVTKIADFPGSETRIDGLAYGNGIFYLTEYISGTGLKIFPYNPATSSYGTTITVLVSDASNRASGGAWAPGALPEPSSLAILAFAGLLAARRRRA